MGDRCYPDRISLLIKIINDDPEQDERDADHNGTKDRIARIFPAVEITSDNYQRPVPDSPQGSAQNAAYGLAELILEERIHNASPPCLFTKTRNDL